jgi:DNA polymerase-3 subunit beta
VGDTEGEVAATAEGESLTVAFNARYLQEALANVAAEQLALEFTGPLSPGVLKPIGDDGYVHVIMPVRTPS